MIKESIKYIVEMAVIIKDCITPMFQACKEHTALATIIILTLLTGIIELIFSRKKVRR